MGIFATWCALMRNYIGKYVPLCFSNGVSRNLCDFPL